MPPRAAPRILVSRTDRIGDVVLTLPLCGLLKARLGAHVTMLARPYTHDVIAACDAVDAIVPWDDALDDDAAAERLASTQAETILHVRPDRRIASAAQRARIPTRVGTSHRLYHWWTCNQRVPLGRRDSALHEAQLDVALAHTLIGDDVLALSPDALAPFGRLHPRAPVPDALAPLVTDDRFTLVVHPRSGGSASEWPLDRWSALIASLDPMRVRVLVTGSAAEGEAIGAWLATQPPHVHDVTGRTNVETLIALLAAANGFIGASTGPLHIAAALGVRTLGLFSPRRPIHPERWRPIGANAEVLVAPLSAETLAREPVAHDVAHIPVDAVLKRWPDLALR